MTQMTVARRAGLLAATAVFLGACAASRPAPQPSGAQNSVPSASEAALSNAIEVANAPFVASRKSKKYYPASCHTVKLIKPADQVGFASMADAEKAGFRKDDYSTDCRY